MNVLERGYSLTQILPERSLLRDANQVQPGMFNPAPGGNEKTCAEILGIEADMHKYAVQITVADVRDGACSSSTLQEAASWGKVNTTFEQMVFAEATTVVPLIGSDAYHRGTWKNREKRRWAKLFA